MTGRSGDRPPEALRTVVPPADSGATRLVLIRHGEAQCARRGVVGGPIGCTGLTGHGRAQVGALADRLRRTSELTGVAALYASILPRAVETAALVAPALGIDPASLAQDCGLCELHPGAADGLGWAEMAERFGEPPWDDDPTVPIAPGGESWSGFVDRAAGALGLLADRHREQTVVVATHAGVVEAAMLRWMPVAGRRRLRLHTVHSSITEWELGPFGWRLLRYNDAAHLHDGDGSAGGADPADPLTG